MHPTVSRYYDIKETDTQSASLSTNNKNTQLILCIVNKYNMFSVKIHYFRSKMNKILHTKVRYEDSNPMRSGALCMSTQQSLRFECVPVKYFAHYK